MEIHQFHTSIQFGDAISDEIFSIRRILRNWGYRSHVFTEYWDEESAREVLRFERYERYCMPSNVVIIHYSAWASPISYALGLPERKILVYHNSTPAEYFAPYDENPAHWPGWSVSRPSEWLRHCKHMLPACTDKVDLVLGDSSFNRDEAIQAGAKRAGVLPILINWDRFTGPVDGEFLEKISQGPPKLLFVGRISPNKCQHDLVRMMECYTQVLGRDGRLLLVGDEYNLPMYRNFVRSLAATQVPGKVIMTGKVTEDQLRACYKAASVFVCMSEHEGFCVPILEAMHNDIPVVACAAGAIEETMNGAGVLLRTKDPLAVAKVADALIRDREFREAVLQTQRERVDRLRHVDAENWLEAALTTLFALERCDGK